MTNFDASNLARHIGVEIECESDRYSTYNVEMHLGRTGDGQAVAALPWELAPEGSLRGGNFGWELRTVGGHGLPASTVLPSLAPLADVFHGSSGTWRAAVHTHVDCRDFSVDEQRILIAVLYCMDDYLFDITNPERRESNFCVPLSHFLSDITVLMRCDRNEFDMIITEWTKYTSCNLHALARFGTVEFRHMRTPGAVTYDEAREGLAAIKRFASLCTLLVQYVKDHVDEGNDLHHILAGLSDTFGYTPTADAMSTVLLAYNRREAVDSQGQERVMRSAGHDPQRPHIRRFFRNDEVEDVTVMEGTLSARATAELRAAIEELRRDVVFYIDDNTEETE